MTAEIIGQGPGMNIGQFDRYIVQPVLGRLEMSGLAARRLLAGTALTEGRLCYIDQVERGGDKAPGPAYGPYQMEKATHNDIWLSYLSFRAPLATIVKEFAIGQGSVEQMHGNWYYATAMARIHYRRARFEMPAADNYKGMAEVWKTYYNTAKGAGDAKEAEKWFALAALHVR